MTEAGSPNEPAPSTDESSAAKRPAWRRSRDVFRTITLVLCVLGLGGLGTYYLVRDALESGAFTDGEQMLDAKQLPDRRRVVWVEPQPLEGAINTADREEAAAPTADGEALVYAVGQPGANVEIWIARRGLTGEWSERRPLIEVNSLADDQSPLLVGDRLYFASNRSGGFGGFDLYVAEHRDGSFEEPRNLGPLVNSVADDLDPAIDARGFRLVFASTRASAGARRFDLFECDSDGELFGEAHRIETMTTDSDERYPCLSPDGLGLIFASSREGGEGGFDLYRSLWDGLEWLGPFEAGSINGPGDDLAPRLTADGFTLYFSSERESGLGDLDLYRAESRELFPIASGVDLYDKIAGTLLLLILTLLLLVFLGNRWKALDILAKCLLLSLLLHLLLLLWFRTIEVTGDLVQRQAGGKSFRVRVLSNRSSERPEANLARQGEVSLERRVARVEASAPSELTPETRREVQPAEQPADRLARSEGPDAARPERSEERSEERLVESLPRNEALPTESFARRSGADARFATSTRSVDVSRQEVAAAEPAAIEAPATALESAPREIRRGRGELQREPVAARAEPSEAADRSEVRVPEAARALAAEGPAQRRQGVEPQFTAHESRTGVEPRSEPLAEDFEAPALGVPGERARLEPRRPVEMALARSEVPIASAPTRPAQPEAERGLVPSAPAAELLPLDADAAVPRRQGEDPRASELAAAPSESPRAEVQPIAPGSAPPSLRAQNAVDLAQPNDFEGTTAERVAIADRAAERSAPALDRQATAAPETARALAIERPEIALRAADQPAAEPSRLQARQTGLMRSTVEAASPRAALTPRPLASLDEPRRPRPDRRRSPIDVAPRDRRRSEPRLESRAALDVPAETRPLEVERPPVTAQAEEAPPRQDDPGLATKLSPKTAELFNRRDVFDLSANSLMASATAPRPKRWAPDRLDRRPAEPLADRTPQRVQRTPYQARYGDEKRLALETFGGTAASERAVESGLRYLASIRNDDGSWGRGSHRHAKYRQVAIGKTSLSLLAFLGAGHTQFSETKYSRLVRGTVRYLLEHQDERTGHFGDSNAYSHGIATYALAEDYALTGDETVRPGLERAVAWILQNQRRDESEELLYGGWGYYLPRSTPQDRWPRASVTAWQVMALESARIGGLEIPQESLEAARTYLESSFDRRRRHFRYSHDPARLRSSWPTLPGSTPASVFALQLLGAETDDVRIELGVRYIRERTPRGYEPASDDDFVLNAQANLYFWYYATLAMFLRGGEDWDFWNSHLRDMLVEAQNDDGSWKPISQYAEYANDTRDDRSYTTAMCVLMLEVYYRYFTPLLREQARVGDALGGR